MTSTFSPQACSSNFTLHKQNVNKVRVHDQIESEIKQISRPDRRVEISKRYEPIITITESQPILSGEFILERLYKDRLLLISERSKIIDTWFLYFRQKHQERLKKLNEQIDLIEFEIDKLRLPQTPNLNDVFAFILDMQNRIEECNRELNESK